MSDVPPRPADGWKMPPPSPIGTDTENDRLRQQQGQRPATAEDYGPLHDQGPQGPSRPLRRDRAWMNRIPPPPPHSARAALKDRIARLHYDADCIRREAHALEVLLRSIPENLPADADEALWTLLTKS